jgi:hypothetical protein
VKEEGGWPRRALELGGPDTSACGRVVAARDGGAGSRAGEAGEEREMGEGGGD